MGWKNQPVAQTSPEPVDILVEELDEASLFEVSSNDVHVHLACS